MKAELKASWATRFSRLCRLAAWLWRTGQNLNRSGGNPQQREQALRELGQGALAALDIELDYDRSFQAAPVASLVVANHVSWLDIFAMSAVLPSSFIAKQEISTWPVLGKMGKNAGTVFINRNSRRDIEPINQAVVAALGQGKNVSFYPEAKTSYGRGVLPFKAALFQSALDAGAPVQAVALRYYSADGRRTTQPSYEDVNLLTCLWRIVSAKKLRIRLDFAPPTDPADYAALDRYALKEQAQNYIAAVVAEDAHTFAD